MVEKSNLFIAILVAARPSPSKKVYRAFDQEEGIEVACYQVKLSCFFDDPAMTERLYSEVRLLKSLKKSSIIALYKVWRDKRSNTLNFITEICTSGNLREYRKKHRHMPMRALKKWSKQILKGLVYLHTHDPCIIHRYLNCSNVFVNGNISQVKIGDLGLAAIVGKNHSAHSILRTPEFMAPELYDEENDLRTRNGRDIYLRLRDSQSRRKEKERRLNRDDTVFGRGRESTLDPDPVDVEQLAWRLVSSTPSAEGDAEAPPLPDSPLQESGVFGLPLTESTSFFNVTPPNAYDPHVNT
ncbi:unnamed protein product [Brassica oleracea var. botrytis]|uniref:non-specific serine/threonine protein kinase n=1 Tax=Brassica napus TaxID=3708 RepID=A0A816L7U7_BRANA|nr:hypothetical protein HID58_067565 [Brassica napus]CAF1932257.1 unnamed protein product [Brassica napus]